MRHSAARDICSRLRVPLRHLHKPGTATCSGRAGSGGHVAADARTFASWGSTTSAGLVRLRLTHRPVPRRSRGHGGLRSMPPAAHILSINAGGAPSVGSWAHLIVNSWRVGGDICGSWYNQDAPPSAAARRCYNRLYDEGIYDYLTSPGLASRRYWPDRATTSTRDLLRWERPESPSGKDLPRMRSPRRGCTNFAIWAMWSAPLIAGNDPRTMTGADPASRSCSTGRSSPSTRTRSAARHLGPNRRTGNSGANRYPAAGPRWPSSTWPTRRDGLVHLAAAGVIAQPADLLDAVANRVAEACPARAGRAGHGARHGRLTS